MYSYTIYISNIWSMLMINNVYISTMSAQYIYYELNMLLTCTLMSFFQLFLLDSRPMISCHVMSCVIVTCLFIIQEKEKSNQRK